MVFVYTSYAQEKDSKFSGGWLELSTGPAYPTSLGLSLSLNSVFSLKHTVSIGSRTHGFFTDNSTQGNTSLFVQYGRFYHLNRILFFNPRVGLSLNEHTSRVRSDVHPYSYYTEISKLSLGIPLKVKVGLRAGMVILSVNLYANVNPLQTFGGGTIGIGLGYF